MSNKLTVLLVALLFASVAEARVFNFSEEGFAPYIGGQYLTFQSADGSFIDSAGTGATFDKNLTTGLSYEFGFAYGVQKVRFIFAFQYLKPPALITAGSNTAGSTYSMTNDVSAIIPKVGMELNIKSWTAGRFFFDAQYGSASATVDNTYTFTAGSVADYKEELKGSGSMIAGGVGFEFLAFDSTTIMLNVGYRSLKFASLKHNLDATTILGGVAKGDPAVNTDGTARSLDLSGYYASIFFRFWLF